jgi:hypothetical protein
VALLPGDGMADLLQPVVALLLRHLGGEGLLHGLALLAGEGGALPARHISALLPAHNRRTGLTKTSTNQDKKTVRNKVSDSEGRRLKRPLFNENTYSLLADRTNIVVKKPSNFTYNKKMTKNY